MDADESTFSVLFERHRRELCAHCYRMVGSFEDSEDLVQDTFARAWRARARFGREGRWSFRAWLYRIATNACLDHVARRGPRVLPVDVAPAADPEGDVPPVAAAVRWLEPYPDRLVDPHEAAVARETLEIGFVATIQHLPPRQRASLILRDVAGFSARETADLAPNARAVQPNGAQRCTEVYCLPEVVHAAPLTGWHRTPAPCSPTVRSAAPRSTAFRRLPHGAVRPSPPTADPDRTSSRKDAAKPSGQPSARTSCRQPLHDGCIHEGSATLTGPALISPDCCSGWAVGRSGSP